MEKSKAAIGFTYEDSTSEVAQGDQSSSVSAKEPNVTQAAEEENSESDDDFDDLDTVINFSALSTEQQLDLNTMGRAFFLGSQDFISYLQQEAEEQVRETFSSKFHHKMVLTWNKKFYCFF